VARQDMVDKVVRAVMERTNPMVNHMNLLW